MAENLPWYGTAFSLTVELWTTDGPIADPGTITCKISKDWGAYGGPSGSVTAEDSTYGQIKVALNATDMTAYHIDGYVIDDTEGCLPTFFHIDTIPVTRGLGGTALPDAAADAAGGLAISDAGGLDLDAIQVSTDKLAFTGTGPYYVKADAILVEGETPEAAADVVTELGTGSTLTALATAAELAKVPKSDSTVSWNATALAAIKTALEAAGSHLTLIKAKTDTIPANPAAVGSQMDLVNAPNATALAAIKDAVQGAGTTLATLLSRIIGTLATGTHNPQTGDAYARLGAAGAGLTALGDARLANLDAAVSGREASGAAAAAVVGLSTFNPATDEVDVGKVKGVGVTDIDDFKADVSGLSTLTAGDLPSEPPSAGTIADAVWDEAAADHVSAGTFGKLMLAFKTLLGHKSIENSESTSVTFRTAGDAGDAGTQSWDEDNKTRGEYTGF